MSRHEMIFQGGEYICLTTDIFFRNWEDRLTNILVLNAPLFIREFEQSALERFAPGRLGSRNITACSVSSSCRCGAVARPVQLVVQELL